MAEQPSFAIQGIYIKDLSLETPQGVNGFGAQSKPSVKLDINTTQTELEDDLYEVVLRLTVHVENEQQETIYLIEIQQAGVFEAKGFAEEDRRKVLATAAPNTLFPYARETIDSLAIKANFPPLRLAPINFDALLANAVAQQQKAQEEGTSVQ